MAFRYGSNEVGWRVAGSLVTFGEQIHLLRGHRNSYPVDGTLGDVDHSNRTSDHNPDSKRIVRALDFFEHELGAVDAVAEAIRESRDPRCKYFIHDKRMFSGYVSPTGIPAYVWRKYTGVNGHLTHGHLSVVADDRAEQAHRWAMPGIITPPKEGIPMWTADLNEEGWRSLAKAGIAAGGEAAVVDYWVVKGAQRTNAEHAAASANMLPRLLAKLAEFSDGIPVGLPDLSGYAKVGHGHKGSFTLT